MSTRPQGMTASANGMATAGAFRPAGPIGAPGDRGEPLTAEPAIGEEPINILIVDDEPGNLVVLETVLDDPGYRLVRAQSADQALLALVEQEFALLILDIRLPGMSGFELAQMIKQRRRTASVPIIFLTAYYDKDHHVLEGYGSGAVDFLSKPVNPSVLRSKVAVFAELHRKNREITLANDALTVEVMERRRAEDQLRELNESLERRVSERTEALLRADHKLQAMMSSITDGLLTLDPGWCFSFCNEQGARLLGTQVQRLLGVCVWELFPRLLGTLFEQGFRQAVGTRQTESFEAYFPQPVGLWLGCHCYPSDEGLSVYFHDISDRREVEQRREQLLAAEQAARAESERVARAKDEFLASLSHELRTPLAAIAGWARILEHPRVDADMARRGVEAIARNARAQAQLVDDLLDMSRIVSGKLRMNVERVDLGMVAAAAAEAARPAYAAKGVMIELRRSPAASTEIMGDSGRLQQVVSNLLTNALKFTPAGGVVTLSTAADEQQVELTVADTGEGIEAEFLPRLFDRFSQADGSAARQHGGLGLGLSIVKNMVELHAGTVTARSAGKHQGATFTARFPRAGSRTALAARPRMAVGPGRELSACGDLVRGTNIDLQGIRVLLVDDHEDMLEVERRMLVDCGASVTTAQSAEFALQCLRAGPFDVLLSDLGLPGIDGYGLIENVRLSLGISAQRLPAAAVTAFARPEDQQRALRAGYQTCVIKPLDPMVLARTVYDLAALSSAGAVERPRGSTGPDCTAPASQVVLQTRRLRVLVVEDNAELREHTGWMLEQVKVDAVMCASGEEAETELARVGDGEFDVIMTDISLPNMSGVELARRVLARHPGARVIFATGFPMEFGLESFGPNVRALLKPFEESELQQLMDEVREQVHLVR